MKIQKLAMAVVGVSLTLLATGELFTRFVLGLGTPPLSVAHPQIEYLFQPSQDVWRFHNHVHINAWSMRSQEFPRSKVTPREFRILMLGDSIINGGNLNDDSELASHLLAADLSQAWGRPVTVGNASAGSWGPPNMLAYVENFGLFDADAVVIVLSSHDADDAPSFAPLNPDTHPVTRPMFALGEAVTRYLPRYVPALAAAQSANQPISQSARQWALGDLKKLGLLASSKSRQVLLFLHWTRAEVVSNTLEEGNTLLETEGRSAQIQVIQLGPWFANALAGGARPEDLYRDELHPTRDGQRLIANAIRQTLLERLPKMTPGA